MIDPLLGKLVAQRYRLIARLGSGGMANVYLARHVVIERLSAIKIVHPELSTDPSYKSRFLREAKAVNRINHPNIVEITDYGESEGLGGRGESDARLVFLVMEYVPGESLSRIIDRGGALGFRNAASVGLQMASALGRAHQMGVIHRDLKPANILVVVRKNGDLFAKLTDFGVAKVTDASTLTGNPVAFGTPGYVAPEYRSLGAVDARSDLYSLGVVLYEMTCGKRPHDDMQAQSLVPPPSPRLRDRAPDVPKFFDDIVMTLLAPDPDDRPRDGFEAYDLLRRVCEAEGVIEAGLEGQPRLSMMPPRGEPRTVPPRGPHLTTVSFDRIAPICTEALARLEHEVEGEAATAAGRAAFAEAKKLTTMVEAIATLCAQDGQALDRELAEGRAIRAELGEKLDAIGMEHSKALGWAGTIAERTYQVAERRISGEMPVNAADAMLWEQAALETEEDRAREGAAALAEKMEQIREELARDNERLERETMVITAQLEGRIAALRALALEAWMAIEDCAKRFGVPPSELRSGPS